MYECRGRQDAESGLFEPEDFSRSCASCARDISASVHVIARLAALAPRPRAHLVRYHGLFAPNARERPGIVARILEHIGLDGRVQPRAPPQALAS